MALFRRFCFTLVHQHSISSGHHVFLTSTLVRKPSNRVPAAPSSTTWNQEFYDDYGAKVDDTEPRTKVIESKEDFRYVARLIPSLEIPKPPKHQQYPTPSGWSPPKGCKEDTPYFVRRTKYHNLPVFVSQTHGGSSIYTIVKHVDGDIWTFSDRLLKHLEAGHGAEIAMHVNEYAKMVKFKGLFQEPAMKWLTDEGF